MYSDLMPSADTTTRIDPLQLGYRLRDFDSFPVSALLREGRPKIYRQCVELQQKTRRFADENLYGQVERWDQDIRRDHNLIPWPILQAAVPYRFYSLNVPGALGGGGYGITPTAVFTEELSAADAGVFVLFGAHALAFSLIAGSLDIRTMVRISQELCSAEDRGEPMLLALAHTEVGGGSDVEDVDDIKRARLGSRWTKVDGGYRVTARKVFISNGSIAKYNVVSAYGDPSRPLDTMRGFLIPSDSEGFSVGRLEHKLGQRLSTAVEIVCDDVFVPDAGSFDLADGGRPIDTALSITRGPVAAMSTGVIRGTLERTLAYLAQKRVRGHWLFEEQHVQLALADMVSALQAARGLYMDAALAVDQWGLLAVMGRLPSRLPRGLTRSKMYGNLIARFGTTARGREMYEKLVPGVDLQRMVGHSSLAKFTCSDLAVNVSMRAMELLGEDANDPSWGVEKQLRDAKLAQIFEGTNQINRLHTARGFLTRA